MIFLYLYKTPEDVKPLLRDRQVNEIVIQLITVLLSRRFNLPNY